MRAAAPGEPPARPRFTGRAAVLVLVVALLMVSYASSMRAWLDQRHHLATLGAGLLHLRARPGASQGAVQSGHRRGRRHRCRPPQRLKTERPG